MESRFSRSESQEYRSRMRERRWQYQREQGQQEPINQFENALKSFEQKRESEKKQQEYQGYQQKLQRYLDKRGGMSEKECKYICIELSKQAFSVAQESLDMLKTFQARSLYQQYRTTILDYHEKCLTTFKDIASLEKQEEYRTANAASCLELKQDKHLQLAKTLDTYQKEVWSCANCALDFQGQEDQTSHGNLPQFIQQIRLTSDSLKGLELLRPEGIKQIVTDFKQQIDDVDAQCQRYVTDKGIVVPRFFRQECQALKDKYEEGFAHFGTGEKARASLSQYQRAVSSLADFTIMCQLRKEAQADKELAEFVKQVKDAEHFEFKEMLQKCQQCLDIIEQEIKEIDFDDEKSRKAIVLLAGEMHSTHKYVIHLGEHIKRDHFSRSKEALPILETPLQQYDQAMMKYNNSSQEVGKLEVAQQLMVASERLLDVVKIAKTIHKYYLQLAELAIKDRQSSSMGMDENSDTSQIMLTNEEDSQSVVIRDSPSSENMEMDLSFETAGHTYDEDVAMNLQKEEYEQDYVPGMAHNEEFIAKSLDKYSLDVEEDIIGKESIRREKSKLVMQRKLERYLPSKDLGQRRDSQETDDPLSNNEFGRIGSILIQQRIDLGDSVRQHIEDDASLKSIDLPQTSRQRLEMLKTRFEAIQKVSRQEKMQMAESVEKYQKEILPSIKHILEKKKGKCGKELENFVQQVERNSQADETERRAREIVELFREYLKNTYGNDIAHRYITFGIVHVTNNKKQYKWLAAMNQGGYSRDHIEWVRETWEKNYPGDDLKCLRCDQIDISKIYEKWRQDVGQKILSPEELQRANVGESAVKKLHVEELILAYTHCMKYTLNGLGVSRDYCTSSHDGRISCSELLSREGVINPLARGQIPGESSTIDEEDGSLQNPYTATSSNLMEISNDEDYAPYRVRTPEGGSADEDEEVDVSGEEKSGDSESEDEDNMDRDLKGEAKQKEKLTKEVEIELKSIEGSKRQNDKVSMKKIPCWLSDEQITQLASAAVKELRSLLDKEYQHLPMKVDVFKLCMFRYDKQDSPIHGQLHGANEVKEMKKAFPKHKLIEGLLGNVWLKKEVNTWGKRVLDQHKNWVRDVPNENENPIWHFSSLYVLQQNGEGPIVITSSFRNYGVINAESPSKDGWKVIKEIGNRRVGKEIPVLLLEPGQQGPDYEEMKTAKIPGRYLKHKDGHRVYLPLDSQGAIAMFCERMVEYLKEGKKEKEELCNKLKYGKRHFNKGTIIGGWELEKYIEPPSAKITCPDWTESRLVSLEQKSIKEFHKKYIDTADVRKKGKYVTYVSFCTWVKSDRKVEWNQKDTLKEYWEILARPQCGRRDIVIWKA